MQQTSNKDGRQDKTRETYQQILSEITMSFIKCQAKILAKVIVMMKFPMPKLI